MRHLILMRHAEAGYAAPGGPDFERPLTDKGKEAARGQAELLKTHKIVPDYVLCSPSVRTKNTWEELQSRLDVGLPVDFHLDCPMSLYQALPENILQELSGVPEQVDIVMMVGHNPGIHEAALTLAQPSNGQAHSDTALQLQTGFSPATMAVFECQIRNWRDVTNKTATLAKLWSPRG